MKRAKNEKDKTNLTLQELLNERIKRLEPVCEKIKYSTGYKLLDNYTNGYHLGDLIIFGQEMGNGLQNLITNLFFNILKEENMIGQRIVFFNSDSTYDRYLDRILSLITQKEVKSMNDNNFYQSIDLSSFSNAILYDCMVGIDIIEPVIREENTQFGTKIFFLDDIAKIVLDWKLYEYEVGFIASRLKDIARELNVVIISGYSVEPAWRYDDYSSKTIFNQMTLFNRVCIPADVIVSWSMGCYDGKLTRPNGNKADGQGELMLIKNKHGNRARIICKINEESSLIEELSDSNKNFVDIYAEFGEFDYTFEEWKEKLKRESLEDDNDAYGNSEDDAVDIDVAPPF